MGVEVLGAAELKRALQIAPTTMKAALRTSATVVAKKAQADTRAAAAGGTPQQQRAANAIVGTGSALAATLKVGPTAHAPFARGAFFGAKKYPQFLPWVGNSWTPATKGQGPYQINDALAAHEAEYLAAYLAGQVAAVGPPFH